MALEYKERLNLGELKTIEEFPDLLEIQLTSFKEFLQLDKLPDERDPEKGLHRLFREFFPIEYEDDNYKYSLNYVSYSISRPRFTPEECKIRGFTYEGDFKVRFQLYVYEKDPDTGDKRLLHIREQNVYMGRFPLMTPSGSFIINGTERVVVSQLQRISGVNFGFFQPKNSSYEKIYFCEIVPQQGPWLRFEYRGTKLKAEMNKKTRNGVWFLRAFGYETDREIIGLFNEIEIVEIKEENKDKILNRICVEHIFDDQGELMIYAGDIITEERFELLLKNSKRRARDIALAVEREIDKIDLIENIIDDNKAEVFNKTDAIVRLAGTYPAHYKRQIRNIKKEYRQRKEALQIKFKRDLEIAENDKEREQARKEFERALKLEFKAARSKLERVRRDYVLAVRNAITFFNNTFLNKRRYNLGLIGRYKINRKLGLDVPENEYMLRPEDLVEILRYLIGLKYGRGQVDDIDSLANKRVRTVAQLLFSEIREGLENMERFVREKMASSDPVMISPNSVVNPKAITNVVMKFFNLDQLSQFMDQTNPLAEITNKRRLSALGKHGLKRETAQMEVRDLHHTHYGRLCPIETPEGQNIGLITSLATLARLNEYGFIATPYRKVKNGRVTDEVVYLTALEEENEVIAQANEPLDENGRFLNDLILCRKGADFPLVSAKEVTYMDVSPVQTVGVSASLIPFLAHDDANRALMGSNMQRQAVPLLFTEQAYVGTGVESIVARHSRAAVIAKRSGVVEYVDAEKIIIKADEDSEDDEVFVDYYGIFTSQRDVYLLKKYWMSNQGTAINQIPRVKEGDRVEKGDIIADGPAMNNGELALGRNVLVAFMPWEGYNFEDAIVISERLLKDDVFTSVVVEEYEVEARETRLGSEEITRDIPNVREEKLRDLDERGIIRIGAEVKPGDILVGKLTPVGERKPTSEELLLQAIFGADKTKDKKSVSLKAPHGCYGTVIDVKVFSRKRSSGMTKEDQKKLRELKKEYEEKNLALDRKFNDILDKYLKGQVMDEDIINPRTGEIIFEKGEKITKKSLSLIDSEILDLIIISSKSLKHKEELKKAAYYYIQVKEDLKNEFESKQNLIRKGDELPPGTNQLVKVTIAKKRKVSIGDKLAGRHGNKGVISTILKEADMPFLEDGTPVDIVLNPLGVPSRMNVGQILETYLGLAVHKLKEQGVLDRNVAVPVFGGTKEEKIHELLKQAGLPEHAKFTLYDGRTGEPFSQKVTVGYMYMMKLIHMVDDKMHARSTGPYSLITQQPLGGKAMFGGQRLGEMEVWAFEAYGAAYTLQEMLTVKSDDIEGRKKMYQAIVKGDMPPSPGIPESFNVVMNELRGLGINVILHYKEVEKPKEEEKKEISVYDIFKEEFLKKEEAMPLDEREERELLEELQQVLAEEEEELTDEYADTEDEEEALEEEAEEEEEIDEELEEEEE